MATSFPRRLGSSSSWRWKVLAAFGGALFLLAVLEFSVNFLAEDFLGTSNSDHVERKPLTSNSSWNITISNQNKNKSHNERADNNTDSSNTTTAKDKKPKEITEITRIVVNDTRPEVYFWTCGLRKKDYNRAVVDHLYQDGISQSAAWTQIYNRSRFLPNDRTVWVAIQRGGRKTKKAQLQLCEAELREGLAERERRGIQHYRWRIFLISFSDSPRLIDWIPIKKLQAGTTQNVVLNIVQRSVVVSRKWNPTTNWIQTGNVREQYLNKTNGHVVNTANTGTDSKTQIYHHMNFPVRTDIVRAVSERAPILCQNATLPDTLEMACDRPIDVAHFWEPHQNETNIRLRTVVSNLLVDQYCWSNLIDHDDRDTSDENFSVTGLIRPICYVGLAGKRNDFGRKNANTEYVDTMLRTKIVVVAQRTGWEGHWRLMEALVTGALVMTDHMLSLPAEFQDGVSLVEYASADELLQKVRYYTDPFNEEERLTIAKEGRRLAMEEFRSWHLMEKLLLGKIVTYTGYQVEP